MATRAPLIGVISDTHGDFDPAVPTLFQDVAHILHGGDICGEEIVAQPGRLALSEAATSATAR